MLPCDETKNSGMVEIIKHLHQYVLLDNSIEQTSLPGTSATVQVLKTSMQRVLFGGDQLTTARARGAKKTRMNSTSAEQRLDGLIPCVEDWHTKLVLIEVHTT